MSTYTRGPWRWYANSKNGQVYLATERGGQIYVMRTARSGMQGAIPVFQRHGDSCDGKCGGCGLMEKASAFAADEDHNGNYVIDHPDAQLIAAAPTMFEAIKHAIAYFEKPDEVDETDTLRELEDALERAGA